MPTEAGRLVWQKAQTLLEIESDLVQGLHLLTGRTKIAFASTPAFGSAHLPVILKDFMLACAGSSDLTFAFHTPDQIMQGLNAGQFDAAVMENCEIFDLSTFEAFPLPDGEVVFASAPSLNIATPETTVEALRDVPLFARREGCCSRTLLEANLKASGYDLRHFRRVIILDDLHLVIQAVLEGGGITFLSKDLVVAHIEAARLKTHKVPGFRHSRKRALVVNRADWRDGAMAHFVSALFAHFALPAIDATSASSTVLPLAAPDGRQHGVTATVDAPTCDSNRQPVASRPSRKTRTSAGKKKSADIRLLKGNRLAKPAPTGRRAG